MPIFELYTNLGKEKIPDGFLKETSELLSKTLVGKPEQYVMVHVLPDQLLIFGGSDKPCGYATINSIGALGVAENKKHAAAIYDHVHKKLGIEKDRFYISFNNRAKADIGFNGTTFDDLL